jgi:zinc transporter ZupT
MLDVAHIESNSVSQTTEMVKMSEQTLVAAALTTLAGLATGIGGLIAVYRRNGIKPLDSSMGI